jgi:hypothetical protein
VAGKETFRKAFALLDSDVEGERQAALHQVRGLLAKQTPPRLFRDLLDALDNTVPFEKYRALEAELQKFVAAYQGLQQQNAALAKAAAPRSPWLDALKVRAKAAAYGAFAGVIVAAVNYEPIKERAIECRLDLQSLAQLSRHPVAKDLGHDWHYIPRARPSSR